MEIPGRNVMPLARRCESESRGFESRCQQKILSHEFSLKVYFKDHLIKGFVYFTSVSCIMYCLVCICCQEKQFIRLLEDSAQRSPVLFSYGVIFNPHVPLTSWKIFMVAHSKLDFRANQLTAAKSGPRQK